ncbi:MAG: hypothetical protein V4619_13920 [Bacteroidota bacterium]
MMIIINYPPGSRGIANSWKARLDQLVMSHHLVEDGSLSLPLLSDGGQKVEGIEAINAHIDHLEQFVSGWYEDRCDKYEFDPDEKPLTL